MSALGGSDRKVSDFPVGVPVSWSPDGHYLVTGRGGPPDAAQSDGIYLIPVQGGEARAITRPKAPEVHQSPKFSPDGHRLAFVSCDGPVTVRTAKSTCWTWTLHTPRPVLPGG